MPRLIPIILIHGFDGLPTVWTESGFRQRLIAEGDLDPNLVRAFDYGVASDGTYNNRGDLRMIASRLAGAALSPDERLLCSVDQLSENSVARGGPPQVTIICHSLGGIISRYYLSRSAPDKWGTIYRGNVGRLISIGSPHRGVDLLRLTDLVPRGSLVWWFIRLLERLGLAPAMPATVARALDQTLRQQQLAARRSVTPDGSPLPEERVLLTDTPIYAQLHPDSALLRELNRPGMMPKEVSCHTFYGDIRYNVRVRANSVTLVDQTVSFGDLVVAADSARNIPHAQCGSRPFIDGKSIRMTLRTGPAPEPRGLVEYLSDVSHNRQLANPDIQRAALEIVTA
jgi:pimeloyl-ACP methyl ester carboxylesterase